MERHDHAQEALDAIDRELARPPISVEDAVLEAVQNGRMTIDEANECIEAYQRTFHARQD